MHPWRVLIAAVVTLAGSAVAGAAPIPDSGATSIVVPVSRLESDSYRSIAFTIGSRPIEGLYPGATKELDVMLRNPSGVALEVTSIRGEVVSSSRRRCRPGPATVATRPYRGKLPLIIPAHRTVTAGQIPLAMSRTAPDTCQNTKLTVRFIGTARARR